MLDYCNIPLWKDLFYCIYHIELYFFDNLLKGNIYFLLEDMRMHQMDAFLNGFEYIIKLCEDYFLLFSVLLNCKMIQSWKHLYSVKEILL